MLFKKSKFHIKTLKTLLHVSITRPSSGSIRCTLLKSQFLKHSVIYFVTLSWCCGSKSCVLCESDAVRLNAIRHNKHIDSRS